MHQIIVDIVGPEALKLLIEILVQASPVLYEILRELCSKIDLIPYAVFFDNAADEIFAAGIDLGCIKIIDAEFICAHKFTLGFFKVQRIAVSGKSHASVT